MGEKIYFIVKPGGDADNIIMKFEGAASVTALSNGGLKVITPLGNIEYEAPHAYQINLAGNIVPMPWQANFLQVTSNSVKFDIRSYPQNMPLFIQVDKGHAVSPTATYVPIWGTYFGGAGYDFAYDITYDNTGHIYIAGETTSPAGINNFPITAGAFQGTLKGYSDAFIGRFDDQYHLNWLTYLGGNDFDVAYGIAHTDVGGGKVYVCGTARSDTASLKGFSAGTGSYVNPNKTGGIGGFIARFNNNGAREWLTRYGGGTGGSYCHKVKCDAAGDVFVVGNTSCFYGGTCAPTGALSICDPGSGAYHQQWWNGGTGAYTDGFIAKFDNTTQLVWSTFIGGAGDDAIYNLAIDDANNKLFIVGSTNSPGTSSCTSTPSGIPICNSTGGYNQTLLNGNGSAASYEDAFVARFTLNGNLEWSTLFGGIGDEYAKGIAVNSQGEVYISGQTNTSNYAGATCAPPVGSGFPNCPGSGYSHAYSGYDDDFIAKFDINTNLVWSTFVGGNLPEAAECIGSGAKLTINNSDQVFMYGNTRTGSSLSAVINPTPLTNSTYYNQPKHADAGDPNDVTDCYVIGFGIDNSTFWSSYFGGIGFHSNTFPHEGEYAGNIVATPNNRLYVCGQTYSQTNFPLNCPNTISPYCQEATTVTTFRSDAFVANLIYGGIISVDENSDIVGKLNVYPNPGNGLYTIDLTASSNETIQLEVFNILGESVYQQKVTALNGKNQYHMDLSKIADGIYFVNVQFKDNLVVAKIIKN